ncbi:unnamed protein product, partial [Vitis vinifera]|uniref:SHSP domain-containing protein n=1 Tax=Vitis vinifera TaxID=29760 RepID=D7SIF7_VITVI
MASVEGAKEGKTRRNSSDHLSFQDIVPSSGWSEDEKCHYLLVDLPGFKREEVKLQVDYQTNQLMASGERRSRNRRKNLRRRMGLPAPLRKRM